MYETVIADNDEYYIGCDCRESFLIDDSPGKSFRVLLTLLFLVGLVFALYGFTWLLSWGFGV